MQNAECRMENEDQERIDVTILSSKFCILHSAFCIPHSTQLNTIELVRGLHAEQSEYGRINIRDVRRPICIQLPVVKENPFHDLRVDRAVIAAPYLLVRLDELLGDAAKGCLPGDAVAVVVGHEEIGNHIRVELAVDLFAR